MRPACFLETPDENRRLSLKKQDIYRKDFPEFSEGVFKIDKKLLFTDINADGKVDISDVILTLRMALGLDDKRPCT